MPPRYRILIRRLAFLLVILLPALLYARAGGGQSYSGGGGRSSGGGGGGGGSGSGIGWLIWELIQLCIYRPYIGLPILAIIVLLFIYGGRSGADTYRTSVIRRGNAVADQRQKSTVIESIRQNDPAFDPQGFFRRVRIAFDKIQRAWCAQNLTEVRPFISDGVFERFSLQFDEQRAQGIRNQLEDMNLATVDIAGGYADLLFDVLSIRLAASAKDMMISIRDGTRVSGSPYAMPFVEVWTFLRRRGAKTNTDPNKNGLIEGNCPNCGGAIELNQNANCQYCGALLRSGQYDWVLAEITQECEWQPGRETSPPGLQALLTQDPGFNVQALEDRASVIFWRLATAERLANTKPLAKAALPQFIQQYESELRSRRDPTGTRTWYGDRAVGSVDTLGFLLAFSPSPGTPGEGWGEGFSRTPFDLALLEVRWSGTRFTIDRSGQIHRHEQSAVSHLLLVLARKPGVKSDTDKAIASAHCPTCGAPESNSASGVCDFCGATLNDGSQTWALLDAASMSHPRALAFLQRLREQIPSAQAEADGNGNGHPVAPAAALAWMIKMTLADGQLDPGERELLESYARSNNIPENRVEQMLAAARANSLDVPMPADNNEARAHLEVMARAALADGKITKEESALLQSAGERLGLSEYDVQQLIRRTRSDLFAEARQSLRAKNSGNLPL
jgi:uncharacterized tellurite resistance protein B-like protein